VGIFRLQLFKTSETFIAAQAANLTRYAPVFIGRTRFGPTPIWASGEPEVVTQPSGRLDQARLVLLRDMSALVRLLGSSNLDLIHCHFAVDGVYALPLARPLGLPLVVTIHGFDVNLSDKALVASRRPALLNYRLFRGQLQRSNTVFLCVSDFIRRQALARGFPPDRTRLHYLGIDVEKLAPNGEAPTAGLVLHVGRLVEKKGTRYLIDAIARLCRDGVDAQLVIAGDGPLRAELETHAQASGAADRIRFLGSTPHPEVVAWMRRAAVLCVPSVTASTGDAEGLPTVVLEAAALGRPVVACDNGGTAEAIVHGITGFVVPERDVGALASALALLLTQTGVSQNMGEAARRHVLEHFDMRRQMISLEAVYDEARGRLP
jgi:glycosyltransferase involved in cell wall biosynthesis